MSNPGCESGSNSSLTNWSIFNGGTLGRNTASPYAGSYGGKSISRTSTASGFQQSLLNTAWAASKYYQVSAWVRTNSSTTSTVTMGVQRTVSGTSSSSSWNVSVTNTWQKISGTYQLNIDGNLTALNLYFNGPASGVELYLDEVSFIEVDAAIENLLNNPGFEGGVAAWAPRGSATLTPTTVAPHSGAGAVTVANRTLTWHGIEQSVFGKTVGGQMYYASGWVKTDSTALDTVMLTMEVIANGVSTYHVVASGQASSTKWAWLSGYFTMPSTSSGLTNVKFFIEGSAIGVGLKVDDCYLAPVTGLRRASSFYPNIRLGAGGIDQSDFNLSPKFAAAFSAHFHYASPGNALKFQPSENTDNVFTLDEADFIIDQGLRHGGSSRGHVFVWHNQVSTFAENTTDPVALRTILWDNIDTKGAYFRGRLPHWDVVNEAFTDGGSVLRTANPNADGVNEALWYNAPGIGYAAEGTRYIKESFIRARAADPEAELVYNDYNTDIVNSKSTAVYTMLQDFVSTGVPIDAVGFQAHFTVTTPPSLSAVRTNFQRFQDLGLDLHVTELDYKLPIDANGFASAADITTQGDLYFDYTSAAVGYSNMKLFQTWGIFDGSSWIPGHTDGVYGQALLLDFDYNRKPAYWGVWNAFAGQCEKLAVIGFSPGDSQSVPIKTTLGGNSGRRLNASAQNDFITLNAHVPFAGTWSVNIGALKLPSGGRLQLAVAAPGSTTFTDVGSVQDTYNSGGEVAAVFALGNHDFVLPGDWQFRFTVASKNVASSDYNLTLDYIRLSPVSCAPAISELANRSTTVSSPLPPVTFLAEDDFAQGTLVVTATSSNTTLLPNSAITVSGNSPYYTVAAKPVAGLSGNASITISASDGTLTTSRSFVLSVGTGSSATVTLSNLAATYDGNPKAVTATTDPVGLTVGLIYTGISPTSYGPSSTAPTLPGNYNVVATVNDATYTGSASGTLVISKLSASLTLGNLVFFYDGTVKSTTATTSPSGLSVAITYNGSSTAPSAVGSYAVVATINDPLYQGSASGTMTIVDTKAVNFAATQIITDTNLQYLDLPLSLNTPKRSTAAGVYTGQSIFGALKLQPVNGQITGVGYTNGASMSIGINGGMKVQWNGPSTTPDNSEVGRYAAGDVATGMFLIRRQEFTDGLNTKTVSFTSMNDTLAATVVFQHKSSRLVSGRFRWVVKNNGNFYISNQVGSELVPVQTPNNTPVSLTSEALSISWNSFNPWNLNNLNSSFTPVAMPEFTNIQAIGVWLSATCGINPGSTNQYQGIQVTSLIAQALGASGAVPDGVAPVVTLNGASSVSIVRGSTYTDAGASAIDAVDGTVDPLVINNSVDTAVAGIYAVSYSATDTSANTATATRTVTVEKATATVTLGNLAATYDGNPKPASATTVPAGLTVSLTYNSSATAPTSAGTYPVVATINDPNYVGSNSGTLVIQQASQTITFGALPAATFGDASFALTATSSSGLTVSYSSSNPLVATVTGNTVTL
ncbi:MAG: endo-1,4-beta-xylanase, partial [Akkermansiaceae bacterium]|nr:endo-1,4-beta-xylanase [Akkermansiaceae bacterium]